MKQTEFLAAAWTCLLLIGCAEESTGRKPSGPPWNVVLICMDTVRADHLGAYGYGRDTTPAIDALARRSILFRSANATAGWTKPSVPSFLTGTYPSQHGVYEGSARTEFGEVTHVLPDEALTLAEVFQGNGYRTAAFVHNAQLRRGNGFEQGFERYEQDNLDAREIRWRGLDWLDRRADTKPFFLYLHFLDAHWPFPAPEEWVTRFAPATDTERFRGAESKALYSAINDGKHVMTPADREALIALYDGALAYLDAEIGRFFEGLALRGLAENTLVCIVADHGEEFGEHGKVGHGHGLWQNLLHVPWILHVPGRGAAVVETPVSLVDLFPTLLAAAGLPPAGEPEGVNRMLEPDAERAIFAEHKAPDRYLQSLCIGNEKLLRRFTPPRLEGGEAARLPILAGTRWEAEFEQREGAWVATQLKPRDEEPDDPPELKGPIEELGKEEFRLGGVRVRYDQDSKRQVEAGTSGPELANGLVVKVRGPVAQGVLRAERIKFYPPDEDPQLEVRGTVESLEARGAEPVLVLSGFTLRVTAQTELDGVAKSNKRVLDREQVATFLAAGAGPFTLANAYEIERLSFDLARDAAELAPTSTPAGTELDRALDELGTRLARLRIFARGDQKALDAPTIQELRDIGYGGEDP